MKRVEKCRKILFYKDVFEKFFVEQRDKVKRKIIWTLQMIEVLPRVPEKFLKHVEGTSGLYEIRVQTGRESIRIFCFFDIEKLIVLINGFNKKTQKTPRHDLMRALKIKKEYEAERI